jgi:hypothetical protein
MTRGDGIALLSWRPMRKGALCGFAQVKLPLMVIPDIPVLVSHGRRWAGVPGKAVVDAEGRHKLIDGKHAYVPAFTWRTREIADRFSRAVVEVVERHHPEAFDAKGEA